MPSDCIPVLDTDDRRYSRVLGRRCVGGRRRAWTVFHGNCAWSIEIAFLAWWRAWGFLGACEAMVSMSTCKHGTGNYSCTKVAKNRRRVLLCLCKANHGPQWAGLLGGGLVDWSLSRIYCLFETKSMLGCFTTSSDGQLAASKNWKVR